MPQQRRAVTVVTASHDLSAPGHTGVAGNQPEERKRLVVRRLEPLVSELQYVPAAEPNLDFAQLVQDPAMLNFFETAWDLFQAEYAVLPNAHLSCFVLSDQPGSFVAGFSAPRQDQVQRPTSGVLGQACYYAMDKETPITASTAAALRWDLAVTRRACDLVLRHEAQVVYALVTHPGHHAGPSSYGGFCFVNHAALAARALQAKFPRVAVVDVDYHAGNGTMAIFYHDPTVFFASIHGDPEHDYPFNAGFAEQIGGPKALGTTFNIPLPGGADWWDYKAALMRVVRCVREFGAQALVVSLGLDTLKGDPVAFPKSRFSILPEDCAEMGRILLDGLELPTVVVQEGGYELGLVPDGVAAFLTGNVHGPKL